MALSTILEGVGIDADDVKSLPVGRTLILWSIGQGAITPRGRGAAMYLQLTRLSLGWRVQMGDERGRDITSVRASADEAVENALTFMIDGAMIPRYA